MHDFNYYLHVIIDFFRDGFHEGFARVNAVLGLIIAIIAAYMMPAWKRIWATALGATVAHLFAVWALPILDNRAAFRLPPELLELSYWRTALALYFGYLVIIAIFFFVKVQILPKGGAKH
jgi:hypothetical protein